MKVTSVKMGVHAWVMVETSSVCALPFSWALPVNNVCHNTEWSLKCYIHNIMLLLIGVRHYIE